MMAQKTSAVSFRPARRQDCRTIARLFQISSEGVADYVWSRYDCPGLSLLEIGAQRYTREDTAFSYQNCLLAVRDGRTVGLVHAFAMPESEGEESDPVLRPYSELALPGSFTVSSLAVFPEHRGQGIGRELLAAAHRKAAVRGHPSVSLICFEGNRDAMRLYERLGYRPVARRAVVPHPLIEREGDAVLMARDCDRLESGDGDAEVVLLHGAAA